MKFTQICILWVLPTVLAAHGSLGLDPQDRKVARKARSHVHCRPTEAELEKGRKEDAKGAAEAATGGKAVSVVKVALNGACYGYEVRVHMPNQKQGWLCEVDLDLTPPKVRTKRPIPNPPL